MIAVGVSSTERNEIHQVVSDTDNGHTGSVVWRVREGKVNACRCRLRNPSGKINGLFKTIRCRNVF